MNFTRPQNNNYTNYKKNNTFNASKNSFIKIIPVVKEYVAKQNDFPSLDNKCNSVIITDETLVPTKIEYAKVAATKIQKMDPLYDDIFGILKPGLLYLRYDKEKHKVIIKEGPKTEYAIQMEKQLQLENDITYRMNKAVKEIDKRRQEYIEYYDYMNGEGSYEAFFKIQQNAIEDSDEEEDDDEFVEDEI